MTRLRVLLSATVLLLAAGAAARADELVLKNGRTLVGRITEESSRTIRIELAAGSMTVDRSDVTDIRRGPVPEKPRAPVQPKAEGPRITGGGGERTGPVTRAAPPSPSARTGGADLQKLLAEIEKITLATWPEDVAEGARPDNAQKPWKVARDDGAFEYLDAPPPDATPRRVWKLVRNGDGERMFLVNGVVEMVWQPMYWDTVRREWTTVHPALQDFQRDSALARRIVEAVACRDVSAWVECNVQKEQIARRQAGKVRNTSVNVVPERERMLAAAVRCTGSEPAAKALAQVFELEIDMHWATPAEKIRLAVQRRDLLRKMASPEK